jgi:serine/threonine protein kinase
MLECVRNWAAKRKAIFGAVIRAVAKPALAFVTGNHEVADTYGELVGAGLAGALEVSLGEPAPEAKSPPSDNLNARFEAMIALSGELLDRLEKHPDLSNLPPQIAVVEAKLDAVLTQDAALRQSLDRIAQPMLRQALAIQNIEGKLEEIAHVTLQLPLALEEIKRLLIDAPSRSEWEKLRGVDPDALTVLREADKHFLGGRRKEGMAALKKLIDARGVGNATLMHAWGLHQIGAGQLVGARQTFLAISGPKSKLPASLRNTMTSTGNLGPRGSVWRTLPRGFEIGYKYRIEEEIGRGGMASVYLAVGIDEVNEGQRFAIKVPAPGVVTNSEITKRFVHEIGLNRKLSDGSPSTIVLTLGYERFPDPIDNRVTYALVMEHIDGESLAKFLSRRKFEEKPLDQEEIVTILTPVCEGLHLAHTRKDPIIHRDGKPNNVMLDAQLRAKVMDFGIARLLEDADGMTQTGQQVGTPAYMPPEMVADGVVDARTDVYLLGCLLQEMMTFHPCGDVERRIDLPQGWWQLVGDATNRVRRFRPASAMEFLRRLKEAPLTLDAIAIKNERENLSVEERARKCLHEGNFQEGLQLALSLAEHRRPAEVITQLRRVEFLLPRITDLVKTDKLAGWLRPTVEELAALCKDRSDIANLLARPKLQPLEPPYIVKNSLGIREYAFAKSGSGKELRRWWTLASFLV